MNSHTSRETEKGWEIPRGWRSAVGEQTQLPYWNGLRIAVGHDRALGPVYPPQNDVFTALDLTPLESVRVVILGQDPYHGKEQAHGLAFSVRDDVTAPPSLKNILKELANDCGDNTCGHHNLTPWAERGVLLLNTALTVRAGQPNSHRDLGWATFTDCVIQTVNDNRPFVVFLLWGAFAHSKSRLIDTSKHAIVRAPHPSPLSASRGYLGSCPFSSANKLLTEQGLEPMDWSL